jgi:hypothetical protein
VCLCDGLGDRIEGLRGGSGLIRNLHEQGVEARARCGRHHPANRFFRIEARLPYPQGAHFIGGASRTQRFVPRQHGNEAEQDCDQRASESRFGFAHVRHYTESRHEGEKRRLYYNF